MKNGGFGKKPVLSLPRDAITLKYHCAGAT
jgi:hypothetical protein